MTQLETALAHAAYEAKDFLNNSGSAMAMWREEVKRLTPLVAAEKLASAKRSSLAAFI